MIDNLKVIDGYFDGERFIARGIAGHAITGAYKADGLRTWARLIDKGEGFHLTIDKERSVYIAPEQADTLRQELHLIADYIENY